MPTLLEVIVTSVGDAREAEAGGADRLELIVDLEHAGLTPPLTLVEDVLNSVRIPIRVMLRNHPTMTAGTPDDLHLLTETAAQFARLPIDGIVAGFIQDHSLDLAAMQEVIAAASDKRITFHRAFEYLADPSHAIHQLKQLDNVDRILTRGEGDLLDHRLASVCALQELAGPEIVMLFAAGRDAHHLHRASFRSPRIEVHVGRAARVPQTVEGKVTREQVAGLRRALDR